MIVAKHATHGHATMQSMHGHYIISLDIVCMHVVSTCNTYIVENIFQFGEG